MESCVKTKLEQLGYTINSVPYDYIETARDWYENKEIENFHVRHTVNDEEVHIDRMNFAKRGCADDANLCEVININIGQDGDTENTVTEQINTILQNNKFDTMYRRQLERMSATGTAACYIRLENATYLDNGRVTGGKTALTYVDAENYIPLTVDNGEVTEAAFSGTDLTKNGKKTTLVIFTLENKLYKAETYIFDKNGAETDYTWIQLGEVKPFAVMRVAEVNNIEHMDGFGFPKVYGAIPTLKKLDLCNFVLNGDLDKADKIVMVNQMLCKPDDNGKPKMSPAMKKIFVLLGKKLPDQKELIQEYNLVIRIDEITKAFELCLSLFSMMFGFGSKKYTFENGQIQTATQYVGERQDAMQELNRQRKEAEQYITDIILAIMWFSNTFCGTSYDLEAEISIDFDDSYIEDKNSRIEAMRADAVSFSDIPEFTIRYIMERLNVGREEAIKIMENRTEEDEPEMED